MMKKNKSSHHVFAVPTHIETTPNLPFYLLSPFIIVATYLAPVQPNGCPNEIAPPAGFTFFISNFAC